MKILFLTGSLNNAGGTERVCTLIANGLSELGHEVSIANIEGGDKPFFALAPKVVNHSLSLAGRRVLYKTPEIIYRLRKLVLAKNIDVLISVESMAVLFSLPATLGLLVKNICWEHFNFHCDLGRAQRRLARQLAARYFDSIVTLTERDKRYWLENTKNKNQITAIPNPCPFSPKEKFEKKDTKIVLAVGRLTFQKGFDLLLAAWVKVIISCPDWKLKIVGDGEDKDKLLMLIKENKLDMSVELVGQTNNIQEHYEKAEIFCLSSRFEGFPMVLLETLTYGLPVVAFDCDTGPEEILEETGSALVEANNIQALGSSLISMINNEQLRNEISIKSKGKALKYSVNNILGNWSELLAKL